MIFLNLIPHGTYQGLSPEGQMVAFIGLILLSIINDVDNSLLAMIWLLARIIYVPVYIVGINYLRTGIWAIALICLIIMSVNFL